MSKQQLVPDTLAYGGDAVGRLISGKAAFVPRALPGEELEITVIQEKKSFVRGRIGTIIKAAPERKMPECPFFQEDDCPGCAYLHCDYQTELHWKQQQLINFLCRGGLVSERCILPPFPAPQRFGCRNKLKLRADSAGRLCMVGRDNSSLIPIDRCLLVHEEINRVLSEFKAAPGSTVCWRYTGHDGVTLIPEKSTKHLDWLTETVPGYGKFKVPADGFFQTNIGVAAELIRRTVAELQQNPVQTLTELYCGVGVFSIAAAEAIQHLHTVGVEINPAAIKCARWNAKKHNVDDRCRFYSGDAAMMAEQYFIPGSVLLLDPPRSGLAPRARKVIAGLPAGRMIYISCAPDTLRRDIELLGKDGWQAEKAGLLDMFPGTGHFESMVTLIKR